MREITFAVYSPPKEGLPYLAVIIAPNGDVAAAAAYKTAVEAETTACKPRRKPLRSSNSWQGLDVTARCLLLSRPLRDSLSVRLALR
jgi:hypothetical protein